VGAKVGIGRSRKGWHGWVIDARVWLFLAVNGMYPQSVKSEVSSFFRSKMGRGRVPGSGNLGAVITLILMLFRLDQQEFLANNLYGSRIRIRTPWVTVIVPGQGSTTCGGRDVHSKFLTAIGALNTPWTLPGSAEAAVEIRRRTTRYVKGEFIDRRPTHGSYRAGAPFRLAAATD